MAWIYTAGSRSLELSDRMQGIGLMTRPSIKYAANTSMHPRPRRDGQRSGRDFLRGQVVSLNVEVRPDHRPIGEVWDELLSAWRGDEVRMQGGSYATLQADSGRRVYGRPRPLDPSFEHWLFDVGRATLEFECIDDLWYGPEETTIIRFAASTGGGLRFPARAPFRFGGQPSVRNSSVLVGGVLAVAPVFEIRGPVVDPIIDIPGVGALIFTVSLAYDQRLVVDTSDGWVERGRTTGDLSPFPGALSAQGARLSDIRLSPGAHTVVLRGTDSTNTAELHVRVQPAFPSF